jgi:acetyl-CoA carboxylase, biotin carboxylase subunit
MKKIEKILIANRGEIAIRVMRSARELGIKTVAIYSETDSKAIHLRFADECYLLKKQEGEPYLDMHQIMEVATKSGVDAIHPGYGFLSENPEFARIVEQSGIIFIGPPHEAISRMGDKLAAKELAAKSGVPVIPGFQIIDSGNIQNIVAEANGIGYPLIIKARAGGGGKGMRLVHSEDQLTQEVRQAINEAKDAFGDGRIFIEKYIENPRHIEFQILADQHGNIIHLFERECSIQRRHQKVIEEAPSVVLDDVLRRQMGECSTALAKACSYTNAGTIEYIVDRDMNFYFLEMNTRLQVEHPVTELITGIDLVKEQIRIAEGHPLRFDQQDIAITGHAIEVRVYAEDPENDFLPDVGDLIIYRPPKGPGVRVDDGYEEGMTIPVDYDPLIAKLITFGKNRTEAIARMTRAIEEFRFSGLKNTLAFCGAVMRDDDFIGGNFDTHFISTKKMAISNQMNDQNPDTILAAAILGFELKSDEIFIKQGNLTNCQSNWRHRRK